MGGLYMYQALYRKYRPKDFDSVVGQDSIIKTLKNSIINNSFSHAYMFFGSRGTGKTTVARHLSDILYNLGYIKENKLLEVSSKDLVAEYVGQTSIKTNSVIERALGGVLFID